MLTTINNLEVYKCNALDKYKQNVNYCVSTRLGGVSKYPYESLNISFKGFDDIKNSNKNLDIICSKIGFTRENCVSVFEKHTDEIIIITEENKNDFLFDAHHSQVYDAMITNLKNVPLIITVADCNAICMYDTKNNVIANIHSGWKGTIQKIYLKTLQVMQNKFGTDPADIICIFSPAIQKCCWKSQDKDLVFGFQEYWENIDIKNYVYKDDAEYYHVDFPYVITKDLIDAGIKRKNICNEKICTCCNSDKFFSFRKITQLHEKFFGVQSSIIELL